MSDYTLLATHPDDPNLYILSTPVPAHGNPDQQYGRVLDLNDKILYQASAIISLQARDPWQPYTGDQPNMDDLLKNVTIFAEE